jgi:hypothetical protein
LDKYGLRKKIVVYVKDEGSNHNAMIVALKSIISCEFFWLEKNFQDVCFGHAFEKNDNMTLQKKKFLKNLNMFPSSLPKEIYISASLGLRSLERIDKNGIRLVLKMEFNPKN